MGAKIYFGVIGVLIFIGVVVFLNGGEDKVVFNNESDNVGIIQNAIQDSINLLENESNVGKNTSEIITVNLGFNSTHESLLLSSDGNKLNLRENVVDIFHEYVTEKYLPVFLAKNDNDFESERKIWLSDIFVLEKFLNDDGNATLTGFDLSEDVVLKYVIEVEKDFLWDDIVGSNLFLLGRNYFVSSSDFSRKRIELFENPYSFRLRHGDSFIINYSDFGELSFSFDFVSHDKITLRMNNEYSKLLCENGEDSLDGISIYVDNIIDLSSEDAAVDLVISPKKIVLLDRALGFEEGFIDEFYVEFVSDGEALEEIGLFWKLKDEFNLLPEQELVMPFFENLVFSMSSLKKETSVDYYWEFYLDVDSYKIVELD